MSIDDGTILLRGFLGRLCRLLGRLRGFARRVSHHSVTGIDLSVHFALEFGGGVIFEECKTLRAYVAIGRVEVIPESQIEGPFFKGRRSYCYIRTDPRLNK